MQIVANTIKLLLGAIGTLVFFYRNSEYIRFANEGASVADTLHTVLINNHGKFSYITLAQDARLRWLEISATVLLALMIVVHFLQKRYLK
jgi:hypothetical protein